MLRAAAKKRRAQAENFGLHPATRRLLQSEVARQYPGAKRGNAGGRRLWLVSLLPRLAGALSLVAVLALAIYGILPVVDRNGPRVDADKNMLLTETRTRQVEPAASAPGQDSESKQQFGLSRSEQGRAVQPSAAPVGSPAQPAPPAPAAPMSLADSSVATSPSRSNTEDALRPAKGIIAEAGKQFDATNSISTGTMALRSAAERVSPSQDSQDTGTTAPALASREFARVIPSSRATPATRDSLTLRGGATGTRAVEAQPTVTRAATEATGPREQFMNQVVTTSAEPLLASFALEQAGQELKIIDKDGSIYRGNLLATSAPETVKPGVQVNRIGQEQSVQNYAFRVAGTNRTLRQNVVFYGNYSQANLPAGALNNFSNQPPQVRGANLSGRALSQELKQQLAPARISGRAVLENGQELKVDALSNAQ